MKRFHVHLGVPDLAASIAFYSRLFGMQPTVAKPDYAKWMLDEPRVNFAISQRGSRAGLNHLGVQAESAAELADLRVRFAAADAAGVHDETDVRCCYAHSDKHWVRDPQGIAWEAFHALGEVAYYAPPEAALRAASPQGAERLGTALRRSNDADEGAAASAGGTATASCCGEAVQAVSECCAPATASEARRACCG